MKSSGNEPAPSYLLRQRKSVDGQESEGNAAERAGLMNRSSWSFDYGILVAPQLAILVAGGPDTTGKQG